MRVILVLTFAAATGLLADDGEADAPQRLQDLARVRAQFETAVSNTLLPELENYARQLLRLEQQFAQRSDWNAAMRTRNERVLVENRIEAAKARLAPPIFVEPVGEADETPSRVILQPRGARLEDGVTLSPDRLTFDRWPPGGSASWTLSDLPPGGYEVVVEYATSEPVDRVLVAENFFTLAGTLPSTGSADDFQRVKLGTLKIRTPGEGLRLELTPAGNGETGGPVIKGIILIPASRQ